jgi:hypothetical protein
MFRNEHLFTKQHKICLLYQRTNDLYLSFLRGFLCVSVISLLGTRRTFTRFSNITSKLFSLEFEMFFFWIWIGIDFSLFLAREMVENQSTNSSDCFRNIIFICNWRTRILHNLLLLEQCNHICSCLILFEFYRV